ncbi:MAG: response regulator transcription factor [Sphingomonadaceae bacterium]
MGERHVYIVDDNSDVRREIHASLTAHGYAPRAFVSGTDLMEAVDDLNPGCILLDLRMPDVDGLDLLRESAGRLLRFNVIMISGHGDVTTAVEAMRLGAMDFLEKPFTEAALIKTLEQAFASLAERALALERKLAAQERIATLSDREREVLQGLLAGLANKQLASALGISPRTVEMHRARMMDHLGVDTLPDALRTAFEAELTPLLSS